MYTCRGIRYLLSARGAVQQYSSLGNGSRCEYPTSTKRCRCLWNMANFIQIKPHTRQDKSTRLLLLLYINYSCAVTAVQYLKYSCLWCFVMYCLKRAGLLWVQPRTPPIASRSSRHILYKTTAAVPRASGFSYKIALRPADPRLHIVHHLVRKCGIDGCYYPSEFTGILATPDAYQLYLLHG